MQRRHDGAEQEHAAQAVSFSGQDRAVAIDQQTRKAVRLAVQNAADLIGHARVVEAALRGSGRASTQTLKRRRFRLPREQTQGNLRARVKERPAKVLAFAVSDGNHSACLGVVAHAPHILGKDTGAAQSVVELCPGLGGRSIE